MDLRSLALFRVLVALILIIDFLFTRLPWFTLFYTDRGLLSLRDIMAGDFFWASSSSLNFISSSNVYQFSLFLLAIVFFFMLLVGYKTKWILLGSWALLVSFQARNFLILNSGDTLLGLLLFWSLYLPLGDCFSVDNGSVQAKETRKYSIFSINSVAFIFQILFVYYFTFLLKTHDIWKSGQGVYYALMLDNFRTMWGDILLQYPNLMRISSYIVYYIVENWMPIFFLLFGYLWRYRVVLIVFMCVFHFSLGLFLHLGLFSWICMAGWLALLPAEFWEKMERFLPGKKSKLRVYYDGQCSFCKRVIALIKTFLILPHIPFFEAQSDKQVLSRMEKEHSWLVFDDKTGWHGHWEAWSVLVSRSPLFFYWAPLLRLKIISSLGNKFYKKMVGSRQMLWHFLPGTQRKKKVLSNDILPILFSFFFCFCFLYVLMWNVRTLNFDYYSKYMPSAKWNGWGKFFHLHQYWNMFSPKPFSTTGWLILSATVQSDSNKISNQEKKIDLWRQGKFVSMEKPYRYDSTFPVFRLRKMLENLVEIRKWRRYNRNYLKYLCNEWNKKQSEQPIKNIEFIFMRYSVPPSGAKRPKPKRVSVYKQKCPKRKN